MTMKNQTLYSELIVEIISRLPLKDLLRFTCVSKSWLSLITSDSYLSRLQLHRVALSALPLLIVQTVHYLTDDDGANYPNFSSHCLAMGFFEIRSPFHHVNDVPCRDSEVVASCHGVLVLRQVKTHSLALLNPSTGKYHLVPPNPAGNLNVVFSGFGFDYGKKCYKLVTIIKPSEVDEDDRTWGEDNMWWDPEVDEDDRTDIWVMNENTWQWTKVLSILDVKTRFDSSDDLPYTQIIPVCSVTDNWSKILFMIYEETHFPKIDQDEGTLALFDLHTERFVKWRQPGDEISFKAITCKPTL